MPPQDWFKVFMDLWLAGATASEIGKYLGVSEYTLRAYLHAMGLKRVIRRCPKVSRDELLKLCSEGLTDEEIAKLLNTSKSCIAILRRRYRILKRIRVTANVILNMLRVKGFVTSKELRENEIKLTQGILSMLKGYEGIEVIKLTYTSTAKYTVINPKLRV